MRSISRGRPHKTAGQRAEILAAYRQSNLTSHQFARGQGIAASTLYRWLRHAATPTVSGTAAWIEVPNLLGQQSPAPVYALRFANGVGLELTSGFQPDQVRALAQLIRGL